MALTGYLYTKNITLHNTTISLKTGYGGKNLVVGTTWGLAIALTLPHFTPAAAYYFGSKLFLTSTIFDIQDRHTDTIPTLPKLLTPHYLHYLLTTINLTTHLTATYLFTPHPLILYSYLLTQLAIHLPHTPQRLLIDTEPTLTIILYWAAQIAPAQI